MESYPFDKMLPKKKGIIKRLPPSNSDMGTKGFFEVIKKSHKKKNRQHRKEMARKALHGYENDCI